MHANVKTIMLLEISPSEKEKFHKRLFEWHRRNKRDFAWRKTRDPYKVLVAEIMLQKTDAKKVRSVYENFIEKYPTPRDLNSSSIDDIRKEIYLLGIHRRADRLKKIAEISVEKFGGIIPCSKSDLLEFPGVGDYITNAVLCSACGEEVPILDTNIVRVVERIFSIKSNKTRPRTDKALWKAVRSMIPQGKAKEFNLGLLDFGAMICTARNPNCVACVMNDFCEFYKPNNQH